MDEVDDLVEDVADEVDGEQQVQDGETPEGAQAAEPEADEVQVTIGDEAPPEADEAERAPAWVRDLRKSNREKDRRIRELEAKVNAPAQASQDAVPAVGTKPTLEGCDYDAEKFEQQYDAWQARKRAADDEKRKQDDARRDADSKWQAKLADYGKAKAALKVKDFEEAEEVATGAFSVTQQGVILNGADNPALLVYALGRNPGKAKELASIADPVKFAFAVAKLESQLKVTPRKSAPPPERVVRGSAPMSGLGNDAKLIALQAEADRTGDRTKVAQYMRAANQKRA